MADRTEDATGDEVDAPPSPWRVVGWYALFGLIWILLSDWLLEALVPEASLSRYQSLKGGVFILATGALLYGLLVRYRRKTREAHRALAESRRQLRQAQKMEALGRMASGVAHDFNNILTGISGYSQLALGALPPDHEVRSEIEGILRSAERAAVLTRQLLSFSRDRAIRPRVVDLDRIVAEVRGLLSHLVREDVTIATDLAGDRPAVRVDPGRLEQVLVNLVVNAGDAMPDGGRITIATERVDDDRVELRVRDTGVGMDEATLSRVFDPFFTTKEEDEGTGLGLAMVYGFVQDMGGSIDVESEPGRGATFRVRFPVVEEPPEEAGPKLEDGEPLEGSETILVVEDEALVRHVASVTLEEHGYTVLEAGHPAAAVSLCTSYEEPIDLVLLDRVLPTSDGRAPADVITEQRPEARVLHISGYPSEMDPEGDFLPKPFSTGELLRKVRAVLDEEEAPPG